MEEKQSKQPLLFLFVALTASVCLAVTIAYLEIRRDAEVEQLRSEVSMLIQYVEMLKLKINRTETFTKKIDDMLKKTPRTSSVAGSYDDDDDYYDDNYDYDYDDIKSPSNNNNNNSTAREKRSVDGNGARVHNFLHMRTHPMFQHAPDNPQVMAKIVIAGEDDSHTQKPNFVFHKSQTSIRHDKKHNKNKPIREDVEDINECSHMTPVLTHFGADPWSISRDHKDENLVCPPEGKFKGWSAAAWVSDLKMDTKIEIDNGEITVIDSPGIYFFYAQIFYVDIHDMSGYKVYVNDRPVMQCTTTSLSNHHHTDHTKRNSCYTGGLIKLESGDSITLKEVEGKRRAVFEHTKSFFGLFKVANIPSS